MTTETPTYFEFFSGSGAGSNQPATSGTVSTYPYNQGKIIDHAARRGGFDPEHLTSEQIEIATDLLFTLTAEWVNSGFPLWTKEFVLLNAFVGDPNVPCPVGTVDVVTPYWRILNPYRGVCALSSGGSSSTLFGGQPNADVTITGTNPSVSVNFGSATEVDTVGILAGGGVTFSAALAVITSQDGITFTVAQTLPTITYTPGQWSYFDLVPAVSAPFVGIRLTGAGPLVLNQLNFGLANCQTIPLGSGAGPSLNIDDYYNLPDPFFQSGQPNSAWVDRRVDVPIIKIWPTLNLYAFYNGVVCALVRRYIQDPASMTGAMEVPQRWLEALQWQLAKGLMDELPTPKIDQAAGYSAIAVIQDRAQRYDRVSKNMARSTQLAWGEERVRGPINLAPNIAPYTR